MSKSRVAVVTGASRGIGFEIFKEFATSVASDDFSFATGNTIVLDGGTVLL